MMAINGVLEAFFASTSTSADLRNQSRWMIVFSVGFVCVAIAFNKIGLGDSGLVYANILNLLARVIYCWIFIKRYFRERGRSIHWKDAMPPKGVLGVFATSAIVTRWSRKAQEGVGLSILQQKSHLAVGVSCVMFCLGSW
jgi:oligosaccharide translocation protein RFT1